MHWGTGHNMGLQIKYLLNHFIVQFKYIPFIILYRDYGENNIEMVFMLQHVIHVQHSWHLTMFNAVTSVQNIL